MYKSILLIVVLFTIVFSNGIANIDGNKLVYSNNKEYTVICEAIAKVNEYKEKRACNYFTKEEYTIKVKTLLIYLAAKGIKVN